MIFIVNFGCFATLEDIRTAIIIQGLCGLVVSLLMLVASCYGLIGLIGKRLSSTSSTSEALVKIWGFCFAFYQGWVSTIIVLTIVDVAGADTVTVSEKVQFFLDKNQNLNYSFQVVYLVTTALVLLFTWAFYIAFFLSVFSNPSPNDEEGSQVPRIEPFNFFLCIFRSRMPSECIYRLCRLQFL